MSEMKQAEWMKDPLLAEIEPQKLEFIQALVFESSHLKQNQMLPFLMAVMKRSQDKKISFSNAEMETVVKVLRKHASPDEIEKINKVMSMRKNGK